MAHPNEDLLCTGYAAFANKDIPTVLGIFDPAIIWRSGDHNALTGTRHGHDEVVAYFTQLLEVTGGTFTLAPTRIVADDTGAAAVCDAAAERDGQSYTWQIAHIWEITNGKATSLTIYNSDGQTADTAFA